MKKIFLFASIVALFVSCSSKPKFELEVNIHNNFSLTNKRLVIVQNIDGKIVYSDTVRIGNNNFILEIPYEGPALLNISILQTDINNIMMAAEKGRVQLTIEGAKTNIGGTPINERLQTFYNGNDSVSLLFEQLGKKYSLQNNTEPLTAKAKEELRLKSEEFRQKRTQLLIENTDRLVAFIRENVDNPIGEYYFMTSYITFNVEKKLELNSFATEKLKKEFGIK